MPNKNLIDEVLSKKTVIVYLTHDVVESGAWKRYAISFRPQVGRAGYSGCIRALTLGATLISLEVDSAQ